MEHTITESITSLDLVVIQVMLAAGHTREEVGLYRVFPVKEPPSLHSIQLRICAESPSDGFALSIGKIASSRLPSGNGVRVDSHLPDGTGVVVGPDFDNLLAKVIVVGPSWHQAVRKAQRALQDTRIEGVKTNIAFLRAILADDDFKAGAVDLRWLESKMEVLNNSANSLSKNEGPEEQFMPAVGNTGSSATLVPLSALFRKGDAWGITLEEKNNQNSAQSSPTHHMSIERVLRNEFPASLTADIAYTTPTQIGTATTPYRLTLSSTSASASAMSSRHRRGNSANESHIVVPMTGKLIEVLVAEGDLIRANDVVAFVKQMKMELEIRSPRAGRIKWALELEDENGENVEEGVLLAEIDVEVNESIKSLKGRL